MVEVEVVVWVVVKVVVVAVVKMSISIYVAVLLLLCAKSLSATLKFGVKTDIFASTLPRIISAAVISSAALSVQIMVIVRLMWRRSF